MDEKKHYDFMLNTIKNFLEQIIDKEREVIEDSSGKNIITYGMVGNMMAYFDEGITESSESRYFMFWIASPENTITFDKTTASKMHEESQWVEESNYILQIRGDSRVGFQSQEILKNEHGELKPGKVYYGELKEEDIRVEQSGKATKHISQEEFDLIMNEMFQSILKPSGLRK